MHIRSRLLVIGTTAFAAIAALPAAAQIVGGQTGASVGANMPMPNTVGTVRDTIGRTVDTVDRDVNRIDTKLVVATRADVTGGATVSDSHGRRIGTVQSVSADSAVIVNGNRRVRVPISSLYRGADGLVTRMSRSQFNAQASADAAAGGRGHGRGKVPRD